MKENILLKKKKKLNELEQLLGLVEQWDINFLGSKKYLDCQTIVDLNLNNFIPSSPPPKKKKNLTL